MRAVGAGREERELVRAELVGAVRMADRGAAVDHEHPLLLGELVVVRAQRLAGWQDVQRGARALGAERRPGAEQAGLEALRILWVVGDLGVGQGGVTHRTTL